jgi:hypothetical protein
MELVIFASWIVRVDIQRDVERLAIGEIDHVLVDGLNFLTKRRMILNIMVEIRMFTAARNRSLDWLHEKPPIIQQTDLCYSAIQQQLHFVSHSVRDAFGTRGTVKLSLFSSGDDVFVLHEQLILPRTPDRRITKPVI